MKVRRLIKATVGLSALVLFSSSAMSKTIDDGGSNGYVIFVGGSNGQKAPIGGSNG